MTSATAHRTGTNPTGYRFSQSPGTTAIKATKPRIGQSRPYPVHLPSSSHSHISRLCVRTASKNGTSQSRNLTSSIPVLFGTPTELMAWREQG